MEEGVEEREDARMTAPASHCRAAHRTTAPHRRHAAELPPCSFALLLARRANGDGVAARRITVPVQKVHAAAVSTCTWCEGGVGR